MITKQELNLHLNQLLTCDQYNDFAPNGMQVEGEEQIYRVCTAVTASLDVIHQAALWQANALLVHHGYFWRGEMPIITGIKRERISMLLEHKINLFAYHLPLDCHPDLGNNACLAKLFEVEDVRMHTANNTKNLLWTGRFDKSMKPKQLSTFLSKKLGRNPLYIEGSKNQITHIAWCSGGAQDFIEEAYSLGADAYISGEVSERTYYQAKELGIHYYSCGHHATERYGIQALGNYLAFQFNIEHLFVDSNNPI